MERSDVGAGRRPTAATDSPDTVSGRRWEILTAVAEAFAADGYHAVGMRKIAKRLGLNQGTLYHYFKSKDHALLDVCLVGQQRVLADLNATLGTYASFEDRLKALLLAHQSALGEIGPFLQAYASLHHVVPAEIGAPLRVALASYWARLRSMFEDAQALGEIVAPIDPESALRLLNGIFHELNLLARTGHVTAMPRFVETVHAVFVRGGRSPIVS